MKFPIQIHFHMPKLPSINRVIKFFIIADLTFLAGWGLVDPIFSIFIISKIAGATLVTVGTVAAIYWITKSLFQVPIALFLDKTPGEKDDFYALIIGLLTASLALFSFMAANHISHIYIITIIKAVAFSIYVPAWSAIFSRHLDQERFAFDWALSSTAIGLSMGVAGFIGGWLAKTSFNLVFLLAGFLALVSALILLLVPNLILPPKKPEAEKPTVLDHGPVGIQK